MPTVRPARLHTDMRVTQRMPPWLIRRRVWASTGSSGR